jgi:hypothetical protein
VKKILSFLLLLFCLTGGAQVQLTPVIYQGFNWDGSPQTNMVDFSVWPFNNPFYVIGTNIVGGTGTFGITPNSSGYFSNNLLPITYSVQISNQNSVAVLAAIPYTTNVTPFSACVTNSPVTLVSGGFFSLLTNWLGFTPCASNYNAISNALTFGPATNTLAGISGALGYVPCGSNYASIVNALGFSPTNLPSGQQITNVNFYAGMFATNSTFNLYGLSFTNTIGATGQTNVNSGTNTYRLDNSGNATFAGTVSGSNGFATLSTYHIPIFACAGWTNTNVFDVTIDFPNGMTNLSMSNSTPALIFVGTNSGCYSRRISKGYMFSVASANMSVTP